MYISTETSEQTETRLRAVIAAASLVWWDGAYAFEEHPVDRFPEAEVAEALAFVRDGEVWSVLKPARADAVEPFGLFSFHFADGFDNSGFVGWLASLLKRELGTGVFVICGQNSGRGGIFDYWGVPISMREQASSVVAQLRS